MKTMPFDLKLAKTPSNPHGLDIINRRGKKVRILCADFRYPGMTARPILVAYSDYGDDASPEATYTVTEEGIFDKTYPDCNKNLLLVVPDQKRSITRHEEFWTCLYTNPAGELVPFPARCSTKKDATLIGQLYSDRMGGEPIKIVKLSYEEEI